MGWINNAQFERDHNGQRNICAADGRDGTEADPLVLDDEGYRVHRSHLEDVSSGLYGRQQRGRDSDEMASGPAASRTDVDDDTSTADDADGW